MLSECICISQIDCILTLLHKCDDKGLQHHASHSHSLLFAFLNMATHPLLSRWFNFIQIHYLICDAVDVGFAFAIARQHVVVASNDIVDVMVGVDTV